MVLLLSTLKNVSSDPVLACDLASNYHKFKLQPPALLEGTLDRHVGPTLLGGGSITCGGAPRWRQ